MALDRGEPVGLEGSIGGVGAAKRRLTTSAPADVVYGARYLAACSLHATHLENGRQTHLGCAASHSHLRTAVRGTNGRSWTFSQGVSQVNRRRIAATAATVTKKQRSDGRTIAGAAAANPYSLAW